ncbi:uncharacterized protein LOC105797289 isoform X1 [Gossypium raimondii]|uniref:uncharacterized protein LOC105797289 isoform X1 n=1 Tax=Gossypium raimondii TaxID=29730 RepID=UPI00227B7B15|nr:uncharacterized protein LOC105797289 isoform X1 [Gossypium raimondii]XP_052484111.1 uncharacterized protein LOC105797289 isoform X1 [Gossypium raimondii]
MAWKMILQKSDLGFGLAIVDRPLLLMMLWMVVDASDVIIFSVKPQVDACRSWNGQYEMALGYTACTYAADNLIFMREVVRAIANKHGMLATFVPNYDRIQPNTWSGAYQCWGKENREAHCIFFLPCNVYSHRQVQLVNMFLICIIYFSFDSKFLFLL